MDGPKATILYKSGWLGRNGIHGLDDNKDADFYREVLEKFALLDVF